ncbi:DUF4348 domain-containing protein [uncultured Draconibacterium sp.]|uniref:DUF4348 domain-containing protein n=1 Tax=uncultured Draconibacterium sp. TaxID=1573823 RepID=UPI002AA7BCCB|nr:DUF4348 domain-containing protein [uncultured Draconibacterium sp.]
MKSILIFAMFLVLLSSCNSIEPEDFDDFYERFHQDSLFQQSRLKFPIQGSYKDFDTTMEWTSSNWGFIRNTVSEIDSTEYDIIFKKSKRKVIEQINCKDCGLTFEIRFEVIDQKWYLTMRQDNNF